MKGKRTTDELDALLGRGGLGACKRDSILETVLQKVTNQQRRRRLWRWSVVGAGLAAAAASAVLIMPRHLSQPTMSTSFRAKGTPTRPIAPSARVDCLGGTLAACPAGSLLVLNVVGARGFVSAWAEPVGGGERIWYFSADTHCPWVDGLAGDSAAANRAVKIGPEHSPGRYLVEIRVTSRPMGRADLLRLTEDSALVTSRSSFVVVGQ